MNKSAHVVVSDDGGKTRFESRDIELGLVEGVVPGGVFHAAGLGESAVALVTFDPGFQAGFHNTPDPTYMFIMRGRLRIEVSDGDSRTVEAGDIVEFRDSDGEGHASTVLGDDEVIVATAGFAG